LFCFAYTLFSGKEKAKEEFKRDISSFKETLKQAPVTSSLYEFGRIVKNIISLRKQEGRRKFIESIKTNILSKIPFFKNETTVEQVNKISEAKQYMNALKLQSLQTEYTIKIYEVLLDIRNSIVTKTRKSVPLTKRPQIIVGEEEKETTQPEIIVQTELEDKFEKFIARISEAFKQSRLYTKISDVYDNIRQILKLQLEKIKTSKKYSELKEAQYYNMLYSRRYMDALRRTINEIKTEEVKEKREQLKEFVSRQQSIFVPFLKEIKSVVKEATLGTLSTILKVIPKFKEGGIVPGKDEDPARPPNSCGINYVTGITQYKEINVVFFYKVMEPLKVAFEYLRSRQVGIHCSFPRLGVYGLLGIICWV